ncbi:hypothetical protein [Segniliparus rugosus]|uniref:Uncharacterized protein n=1 Tax=Segniliparus rugosus (strain ATCC BAA-974 / DSM 45345 / CCUG 50838 / CIP 108380 / JCM 13579 / CDC 945) TaxID=679197 RepID=E5XQ01_SEGRC|nr:hypothetical protein [Segniliparus rugosus]EFV13575.2 hypothetical protein HMPREF9336_01573 [Segniliparus rugosus ATCC BAA-974]
MKILAASASFALAIMFGGLADAALAAPAHSTVVVAHFDDDHGHNDTDLDNNDPVTNQGPNKVTPRVRDDERTAGGTGIADDDN